MRTMVLCKCENCGKEFERRSDEFKRCQEHGYTTVCSRSCAAVVRNKKCATGNLNNLRSNNRLDEFSPFRYYVNKARSGERVASYGQPDITVEYLKEQWEKQKGLCPYSNKQMVLPFTTKTHDIKAIPQRASLDRIDSSKGYIQGNVEFVCYVINLAKNRFSREQMLEFFGGKTV